MTMLRSLFTIAALTGLAAACGDEGGGGGASADAAVAAPDAPVGPELIDGFTPPALGAGEIQFISPPTYDIPAGADITYCHYLDYEFADTLDIHDYLGYQSVAGGHHTILYAVTEKQPAGSHECTEVDMLSARYLAGAGADSPATKLPEGVVIRIPAATQVMIQDHWINAGETAIDGQSGFNIKVAAPSADVQTANLFTIPDTDFTLPTGPGSTSIECTAQQTMNFFMLGGHMHEWGTHVTIDFTPAGGAAQTIYDHGWTAEDQFDPPMNRYTTAEPFVVHAGDKFSVQCQYENDTGEPMYFPSEMCVMWGYFYPTDRQLDCVDGNWPN